MTNLIPACDSTAPRSGLRPARHVLLAAAPNEPWEELLWLDEELQTRGWRSTLLRDGLRALQTFTYDPPDLVLVDLDTGDIDGFELCRAFKQRAPHIRVVFLVRRADPSSMAWAFALGADRFVVRSATRDGVLG